MIKNITSKDVCQSVEKHFSSARFTVPNCYFFGGGYGETDVLIVQASGLIYDVEIKVSRSDFFADFKKVAKHEILEFGYQKTGVFRASNEVVIDNKWRPNKFMFAVPEGLIKPSEVPHYAGLLYLTQFGGLKEIKKTPFLHKEKIEFSKRLVDKFYWGYRENRIFRDNNGISELNSKIRQLEQANEDYRRNNQRLTLELNSLRRKSMSN